jgi:hypothetical protein
MKWRLITDKHDKQLQNFMSEVKSHKVKFPMKLTLDIAIGDRVCLLKNLDSSRELVNGKMGTVRSVEHSERETFGINILFDGQTTPVTILKERMVAHSAETLGEFKVWAFPIRVAWAMVAHRLQGLTIPNIWI